MDDNGKRSEYGHGRFMSDFPGERKSTETLAFSPSPFGQNCPQDYPHLEKTGSASPECPNPLGEPLAIEQVAALLGCSAWTVRQCYLRQGLPYLQARPRGKLVFFREQVIAWTLKRQRQKGGFSR